MVKPESADMTSAEAACVLTLAKHVSDQNSIMGTIAVIENC